jgi:hypothetical protein
LLKKILTGVEFITLFTPSPIGFVLVLMSAGFGGASFLPFCKSVK